MKITFSIDGGPYPNWWNKNPGEVGLGGSEESAIYMIRELRRLGHNVVIGTGGVRERPEPGSSDEIVVSWRNWETCKLMKERGVLAQMYLLCHDIPVSPHWSPEAAQYVDRVILLNAHHARLYEAAGCPPGKMFVCPNGIDLDQFEHAPERIPGRCIYLSHPHRGLDRLRGLWPRIREQVPYATLHAFWWEDEYLLDPQEQIGIMPMRNLGHEELAREILSSDLFTYPSVFHPEINPISCIKAQAGGAWPVTINKGGMEDTLLPYGTVCEDNDDQFVAAVVDALVGNQALVKTAYRPQMMREARDIHDWRRIAGLWEDEMRTRTPLTNLNPDDAGLAGIEDGVRVLQ